MHFFPHYFYIKVYAVRASILYWFLVLYTYLNFVSYLLFYIRPIAWCIFIRFVNKSSMFYVVAYFVVAYTELPLI